MNVKMLDELSYKSLKESWRKIQVKEEKESVHETELSRSLAQLVLTKHSLLSFSLRWSKSLAVLLVPCQNLSTQLRDY